MTAPVVTVKMALDGSTWKTASSGPYFTGGTVTSVGGYRIHTFTSSGTLTMVSAGDVDVVVVAGGGGGGGDYSQYDQGGGGGAGGVVVSTSVTVSSTQTVTVGAGGAGRVDDNAPVNGSNSSLGALVVASGGGCGGDRGVAAGGGGSGGGGGTANASGGAGTAGQGYAGGTGQTGGASGGGGGGGASEVGAPSVLKVGGDGGDGIANAFSGASVYYGGGGGGSGGDVSNGPGGAGGAGGGGAGAGSNLTNGVDGTANTGGGGGASFGIGSSLAGDGGSGVVIVRYQAGPVWTDITAYVLFTAGIQISRGRSGERDEVRAGTCQFTLVDSTRRFDPEYTAGPHYGFLNPGVPVWVYVTHNSLAYDRFYGFVEDWPQGSTDIADRRVYVQIQATDAFGMLALGRQSGIMENAVMDLSPLGYWPLTEQSGATVAVDLTGTNPGVAFDEPTFGSDPLAPGLGRSVEFDGVNDRVDITRSPLLQTPLTSTVIAVVRTSTAADAGSVAPAFLQVNGSPESSTTAQLAVDEDGKAVYVATLDGSGNGYTTATVITDGDSHLLIGQRSGTGADYGVSIDSATLETTAFTAVQVPGNGSAIGGTPYRTSGTDSFYFTGRIGHVAVWDTALTTANRTALLTGFLGRSGEGTDERIGYILDRAGFPALNRSLTAGYTTLGAGNHEGQFTLELLRRIEKSEQGRFFVAKNGTATFHARYHGQLVATTSSATLSDDGADVGYSQVEVNRPRAMVYNDVTVTADGLSPITVHDATSISSHGERELTIDAPLLPSPSAQQSLAEYVLALYKDPQPRVTGVSVPVHRNWDVLVPIILPLEQGDRVTFERSPVTTGSAISLSQTLEGYTERFDSKSWTWTPSLSPAQTVTYAVWSGSAVDANEWGTGLWGY